MISISRRKEQREQLRKAREAQLAFQQMQMSQMIQQQAERKAAQERATAIEGAYRGAIRTPQQQAMQQFGGPTQAAATAAPGMVPQVDQRALIESLAKVDPMTAFQMMLPKQRKLTTVAPGASVIDESDPTRAVFTAPDLAKRQATQPFDDDRRQAGKPSPGQPSTSTLGEARSAGRTARRRTALRKDFNALPEVVGDIKVPAFKADRKTRLTRRTRRSGYQNASSVAWPELAPTGKPRG
ncbi:MAG: hypothetical protein IPJ42_15960 [Betaproteobacteria bacterium]|nr:hypothetical protein [Betaproteobacteria bacterium]